MFSLHLSHLLVYLTYVSVHLYFYLAKLCTLVSTKQNNTGVKGTARERMQIEAGMGVKEQSGMQRKAVERVRLLQCKATHGSFPPAESKQQNGNYKSDAW